MATQAYIRTISNKRNDIFFLDAEHLTPLPNFNRREDFGDIEALKASIRHSPEGVEEAIRIKTIPNDNKIYIVNGERRYKACIELKKEGHIVPPLPCRLIPKDTSDKDLLISQLVMNSGKPMDMLEKGLAYMELHDTHQMTGQDIAERMGDTTKQAVSQAITLVKYGTQNVLQMIRNHQISASAALEVIKLHKNDKAAQESKILDVLSSTPSPSKATVKAQLKNEKENAENKEGTDTSTQDADTSSETTPDTTAHDPTKPIDWSDEAKKDKQNNSGGGNGGGSGGNGTKNMSVDKRHQNLEACLCELNLDNCHEDRVNTLELILTYLSGESTITPVKKHLLGKT